MTALRLTGIYPGNDHAFAAAKARLAAVAPGFEHQFKRRMISDITAPGCNAQMEMLPFRYININDFVALVKPNCWMAVVDIVGYYLNFPLAINARPRFGLRWGGLAYVWGRLPFGGASHPYLASVITAEICTGLRALGIPVVAMIDDFGMVGDTYDVGWARLQLLQSTIRSLGLSISEDKNQFAQKVKFIGFWVDAVKMVISFDTISTAAFAQVIHQGLEMISAGAIWDNDFARHLAGKLNHFASVVQAGRMRLDTVWAYVSTRGGLSPNGLSRLQNDLRWWEHHLLAWAEGGVTAGQFPIINTATLLLDPLALLIGVTDYSGPDGVGGYWGRLEDVDPEVFTHAWLAWEGPVRSSLVGELYALWHLLGLLSKRQPPPVAKLFIWVTDNLGAAFCVNAGRCSDEHDGRVLLMLIFELLMGLGWYIIAIWHPRTSNCLADFYSHLSRYLGVEALITTVTGARSAVKAVGENATVTEGNEVCVADTVGLSGRAAAQGLRIADYADQRGGGGQANVESIPLLLPTDGSGPTTSVSHHRGISLQLCGTSTGVHALSDAGQVTVEDHGNVGAPTVAFGALGVAVTGAVATDEVRGSFGRATNDTATDVHPQQGYLSLGPIPADDSGGGIHFEDRSAGFDAGRRGDEWHESTRYAVEATGSAGAFAPVAHQARSVGSRAVRHRRARRRRQVFGSSSVAASVDIVGSGHEPGRVFVSGYQSGSDRASEAIHRHGVAGASEASGPGSGV
jgi:hypothetical protein